LQFHLRSRSLSHPQQLQTRIPAFPSLGGSVSFCTALAGKIVAIENEVGLDAEVDEHTDSIHAKVDESRRYQYESTRWNTI